MFPSGQHRLLVILQTALATALKRLPLRFGALDERVNHLVSRQSIRRKIIVRKYPELRIRLLLIRNLLECRSVGFSAQPTAKPRIDSFAAGLVVVVIEIETHGTKLLRRVVQIV